jgi:hypothetical protein
MRLEQLLETSGRVEIADLDWKAAAKAGLSDEEAFLLTFFADIESQTIGYMRDLMGMPDAFDPEVAGFISVWNYEEYFHGRALAQLLEVCGRALESDRIAQVRNGASLSEVVEAALVTAGSRLLGSAFTPVVLAWGSMQELTTVTAYRALGENTQNPVLRELAQRIGRQERRHFAWYYNRAREKLALSAVSRRVTRFAFESFWKPVGAGVKPPELVEKMLRTLFREELFSVARDLDRRIAALPGLEGLTRFSSYVRDFEPWKPAETRAAA